MNQEIKNIIITGAGQDSTYMIEHLLESTTHNIIVATRSNSRTDYSNIEDSLKNQRVRLITFDLNDGNGIRNLIKKEKPDYFINLAAATFVKDSWDNPVLHMQVNAISLIHMLEAIKDYCPKCRFYSAGSSEEWGNVDYSPQDEGHPYKPRSIYGVSKVAADHICKVYRESYGLFAVHGLLLNHESPLRTSCFITRKITTEVARICKEIKDGNERPEPLVVGNILAKRDWSHAKDFVKGIWLMVNQDKPKKYVLSSNETHSVKELIDIAFKKVGINLGWGNMTGACWSEDYLRSLNEEELLNVSAFKSGTTIELVKISKEFFRPCEVSLLHGDSSLARKELGWKPEYSFEDLINEMMEHDLKQLGLRLENS